MSMQEALFSKIKDTISNKKELPKVLQDVLGCSADSAYRRLRGETALSIDEAYKLSDHFKVALSDLESFRGDHVTFVKRPFINSEERFEMFLEASLGHLELLLKDPNHVMLYTAKDIPPFYQYRFKALASFKIFVWFRSFYDVKQSNEQEYTLSSIPQRLLDIAYKQWEAYSKLNAIEIWNDTTVLSLINQIEFYYEAGLLADKDEALLICDEFMEMIKVVYKQAIHGRRMLDHDKDVSSNVPYKLYYNEVLIMDNNILSKVQGRLIYNMPYAAVNYISTTNEELCGHMEEYILRQAHKSALISDVSEKERNKFFIRMRNKVEALRDRIEQSNPFLF